MHDNDKQAQVRTDRTFLPDVSRRPAVREKEETVVRRRPACIRNPMPDESKKTTA